MYHSRDISDLRPDVAQNCRVFLRECEEEGLEVLVTETVRDKAYQEYLYEQGYARTKTPSFHAVGVGLAFDIAKNVKGHEYDDPSFFERCAVIGKRVGFEWGGDWKSFVDRPHFQWSGANYVYTSRDILAGRMPPTMPLYAGEEGQQNEIVYRTYEDVPDWAKPTVKKLMDQGWLLGEPNGDINLTFDMVRLLVINDRAGLYGE